MAGERAARRQRFFEAHPRCCFCAGETPAVEEDHQPGRLFFRERGWPEGFVFPACEACNRVSREAENLVSILAADVSTERSRRDYQKRVASVRHNYPGIIEALLLDSRAKRKRMADLKISRPEGVAHAEMPLVQIDAKRWAPQFTLIGRKLMLALHYQCFGTSLTRTGRLWLNFATNARLAEHEGHRAVLEMAERIASPMRSSQPLADQFAIRWNAMLEPRTGVFIAHLQTVLVFYGITTEQPGLLAKPIYEPFSWPAP